MEEIVVSMQRGDHETQRQFHELSQSLTTGLSHIASAIQWGNQALLRELVQQRDTLRSIDHTLKSWAETRSNELRQQAEEALRRNALDDALTLYRQALRLNRLDYRVYLGLATTYLQREDLDAAQGILERGLPHALDQQSHTLRWIARIHGSRENYRAAVSTLQEAIELSPKDAEAHYDYAQYCALLDDEERCRHALQCAIEQNSFYWTLAHHEASFERVDVRSLLMQLIEEPARLAQTLLAELSSVYMMCPDTWRRRSNFTTGLRELHQLAKRDDLAAYHEISRRMPDAARALRNELRHGQEMASHRNEQRRRRQSEENLARSMLVGCPSLAALVFVSGAAGWRAGLAWTGIIAFVLLTAVAIYGSRVSKRRAIEDPMEDEAWFEAPMTRLARFDPRRT